MRRTFKVGVDLKLAPPTSSVARRARRRGHEIRLRVKVWLVFHKRDEFRKATSPNGFKIFETYASGLRTQMKRRVGLTAIIKIHKEKKI